MESNLCKGTDAELLHCFELPWCQNLQTGGKTWPSLQVQAGGVSLRRTVHSKHQNSFT